MKCQCLDPELLGCEKLKGAYAQVKSKDDERGKTTVRCEELVQGQWAG